MADRLRAATDRVGREMRAGIPKGWVSVTPLWPSARGLAALLSAVMEAPDQHLLERLATESREFDATGKDPERNCWLAVHRHVHGILPSEYDIR